MRILHIYIQWVPGKSVHNLFGFSMTFKSFCLFQCIWLPTRVTYPWCIANWSHWNQCIWSQDPREHKFLSFKKSLVFYCILWGPVTISNDFSGSNWQYTIASRKTYKQVIQESKWFCTRLPGTPWILTNDFQCVFQLIN